MDGDSKRQNEIQNSFRDRGINARNVLQSIRFRHCTILSDSFNREFILRKHRFVLYIGSILWIIFLLSKII